MRLLRLGALLALMLLTGAAQATGGPTSEQATPKWPVEPRWTGSGPMPRHHMVLMWGVPAPYSGMTNPLPRRKDVFDRGAAIYTLHCATCHGDNGAGNGPGGSHLAPPPGNLVWLSDVPEKQWDEFMVWAIAEGGTALGTSMPPYRELLSQEDIWAVTAYIQENIPFVSRMR